MDIIGDVYEYLIARFAATAGKKAGEFYTPAEVSETLVPAGRAKARRPYLRSGLRIRLSFDSDRQKGRIRRLFALRPGDERQHLGVV